MIEVLGAAGMGGAGYAVPADEWGRSRPPSAELRGLIQSVIEETASSGSAVMVAHAASFSLAKRDDVLRVLITASPETRQKRLASALRVDDKAAARAVKRSDAGRADYIKRFHNISTELLIHYDLVIKYRQASARTRRPSDRPRGGRSCRAQPSGRVAWSGPRASPAIRFTPRTSVVGEHFGGVGAL